MFINTPEYVLKINQPLYPETEAQHFERKYREHMANKKQQAKEQRLSAIKSVVSKLFSFANKTAATH